MKTAVMIADLARAAGARGDTWARWTSECDEAQDFICSADNAASDAAIKEWEAAHRAGMIEHMTASGWVQRWTTAPEAYDGFGTETVEACGTWQGHALRRAAIDPAYLNWQADRYGSGAHGTWEEDPRLEEQRRAEQRERWRIEDEARAARRAAGLEWLRTATIDEIDAAQDADDIESRGLAYMDVRDERNRRLAEMTERERVEEIAQARESVRPGSNLIDDGTPGIRGVYGWIAGRPPTVHYAIEEHGWGNQSADEIMIRDSKHDEIGSLAMVARRLREGDLRIATDADALPPEPVLRRFGLERRADVRRVEVRGRALWVARERFGTGLVILDERGRVARGKHVREVVGPRSRTFLDVEATEATEQHVADLIRGERRRNDER
jgi:hypothetical protein